MSTSIVIAGEHALERESIRIILDYDPDLDVVEDTYLDATVLETIKVHCPDLVILEISFPLLSEPMGLALAVRHQSPNTRFLALLEKTDKKHLMALLRAGVSGFALKTGTAKELLECIKSVMSGAVYLPPEITDYFVEGLFYNRHKQGEGAYALLSSREREVTQLIAEGRTPQQIADVLSVSVKTVDTHRSNIMNKLCLQTFGDITRYAVLEGLASVGA